MLARREDYGGVAFGAADFAGLHGDVVAKSHVDGARAAVEHAAALDGHVLALGDDDAVAPGTVDAEPLDGDIGRVGYGDAVIGGGDDLDALGAGYRDRGLGGRFYGYGDGLVVKAGATASMSPGLRRATPQASDLTGVSGSPEVESEPDGLTK